MAGSLKFLSWVMSSRAFLIAIVVAAAAAAPALAVEHIVGDGAGWTVGPNYSDWAKGNDFRVGDTLEFRYKIGDHNVLEVSRADAEGCTSSDQAAVPYMTGNDTVQLASPGEMWFICDFGDHCLKGMKLGITVSSPPPTTVMVSSVSPFRSCGWMLLLMAAYWIIIM